jgi:2-deoxy-D-gluconate 3-dehydrogenase
MILELFRLEGRIAVVTGANRGLGQAMATGLAEAGADIVCISRSGNDEEIRNRVTRLGRRFLSLQADLAEPAQRAGLIDRILAEWGRIDILVNNAGSGTRHPPEDYPEDEWRELLEIHLHATFDLSRQAGRQMLQQGRGKIINIGSVMTYEGGLNIPAYAAAKHAIAGLTKSLAVAWSRRGVNVNCIAPGYFETNLSTSLKDHPVRGRQILERIPCGRWGDPAELQGVVVFLASAASNYMHGSIVPVDGGWLAR